jgi:hypothetical protein
MPPIGQTLHEQKSPVSVLLWGKEGTGKTTSGLRMTQLDPKGKVVLINAEGGAKTKALARQGVDPKRIEVWPPEDKGPGYITYDTIEAEVVKPMREALRADPKAYIGVVVDSFTEVARRLLDDVTEKAYAKAVALGKNRDRFFIDLADHGTAAAQMRTLLRDIRDLNVHLVITALERRDVDQNTSAVTYGPALGPAVATDTTGLVDLVGFCQVERFGDEDFRTATFTPTITRRAKDRYGILPVSLVDPFFDRIAGYIDGEINRENDPSRARLMAAIASNGSNKPAEKTAEPTEAEPSGDEPQPDEGATAETQTEEAAKAG